MTREEKIRAAKIRQAKARQALIGQTLEVDPMAPKADPVDYVAPETEQGPTNLRGEFSEQGFDLAKQASYQGGGVVDVPDKLALYSEDGLQVPIPQIVQNVLEFAGDFGAFAGGLTTGSMGYIIGGMADLAVKAGMSETGARRLARDIMAMPDAFAGSLGTIARSPMKSGGADRTGFVANKLPERITKGKFDKTIDTFTDAEKNALTEAAGPIADTAVDTVQLSAVELGALLQQASKGGRASQAATEALAKEARINPEAAAAAERLGIDLPPDVLSDNPMLKNAAAMTRDIKASEAAARFETVIDEAATAAQEAMGAIDATQDISLVSATIFTKLNEAQVALKKADGDLHTLVDNKIPASTVVSPNNMVELFDQTVKSLGGLDNLSSQEMALLNKITNPDAPLTYFALRREMRAIGTAIEKGEGPYGSVDQTALRSIYRAMASDRTLVAERIGGSELRQTLNLANRTTVQRKELEKRIIKSFGKDLQGSIASELTKAINLGAKGNVSGLNRILKALPPELRREAIATAINVLSIDKGARGLDFGFAQYATVMRGLKRNSDVYNKIMKVLGPDSDQFLTDLLNISERITEARARVSPTGKANQALIAEGLTAENIAQRVINSTFGRKVVRGAVAGGGMVSGGPAAGIAADAITDIVLSAGKTDRVKAAGNLLNSAAFKSLVDADFAANQVALQTALDKLEKSPAYKRWLKSVEMTPGAGRSFLQTAIVAGADGEITPPVVEEPVAEVDVSQSPALQSLIKTTNSSVLNEFR